MPDAVAIVDRFGVIVTVNNKLLALFGYSENEIIGKVIEKLVPKKLSAQHQKDRQTYSRHPVARPMGVHKALNGLHKNGTNFPVEISLIPIYNPDLYTIAFIRDMFEINRAHEEALFGWAKAINLRDHETSEHTERVVALTLRLAKLMNYSESELLHVSRGALLHDIGKIAIPDRILHKKVKLSPAEFEIMKKHPVMAHNMISHIEFLKHAVHIPYCHHEHWDGTGYPNGLIGAQIPLEARLFSIIDVYDALTSKRPYRKAWTKARALRYIRSQSGKLFDPEVTNVFFDKLDYVLRGENEARTKGTANNA